MNSQLPQISLLKKTTAALASLFFVLSPNLSAKEIDFERIQKELKIMSNIFQTSLNQQSNGKHSHFASRNGQATYLANQGMVFNFKFGQHSFSGVEGWEAFGEGIGDLVGGIASEVGNALGEAFAEGSVSVDLNSDLEERFERYEERMEALEQLREQNSVQREEVRQLQREIRKLERDTSRINEKKEHHQELKQELEQKVDELKQKMNNYHKSMQEYRVKRMEKYNQNAKQKSDTIISTLCDYGATIRSLEDSEHITLIFENYTENFDQIYVFNFEDIRQCRSANKLLGNAISYQL